MRDTVATSLLLAVFLLGLLNVACPFRKSNEMEPIGPTLKADILIYFNSGLTQEEINAFSMDVLSRPHPEGRGYYLPPGVRTFLRLRKVEGHDGIAITFFPNATNQQREELKKTIKASPLVYAVIENEAPDDVRTLKRK